MDSGGLFASQHRCEVLYPLPDVYILVITTHSMRNHLCLYLPGKETETQHDLMTCPRLQSQKVAEAGALLGLWGPPWAATFYIPRPFGRGDLSEGGLPEGSSGEGARGQGDGCAEGRVCERQRD